MVTEAKIEFDKWSDEGYCLEAVKQRGSAISYVHNQTEEICLATVKQKHDAIKYVHNKDMWNKCLFAIKKE